MIHGVIIAGGVSKRLRPRTENIPKTLLKLDQKVILEHILDSARIGGISHFDILTGHGHDYVEGFMKLYKEHYPEITFDVWFIERYAETGNIIALQAGQHLFNDDVVIINSDTIFHPDIIRNLLASEYEHAMVIDDTKTLGEEEMKVFIDDEGMITRIHKSLDPTTADGEYVGILKFSPSVRKPLAAATEELMANDDSVYYEDGIQKAIDDHGLKIHKISSQGLPVMEIDTHEDLEAAHTLIKDIIS